ncbi:MAG: redoxin domain-containing protein [Planctomycetes bacterium]|nr:redoxin domain-containing protein [Planctomycetota bacterium]
MKFPRTLAAVLVLAAAIVGATAARGADKEDASGSAVGRRIEGFTLPDFRGRQWRLADFDDSPVVAVLFLGTECPIVRLYAPRLVEIQKELQDRGVQLVAVNSNQQDSLAELEHFARVNDINFPMLKDPGNAVADQFGAARTPEVFVLDRERRVRYHGRIDDQYTYGLQKPKVEREYLSEAIESLVAGKEIATPYTEPVGCLIGRVLPTQEHSQVTYSRQISRILQKRCVECHRPGEIGPFSLTEYDEAAGWAEMIAEVVHEQRMPPWHASPEHGDFVNDARLTDEEKELIYRWVDAGAPEGDPSEAPPPRVFVQGWRIGEPDLIVLMAEKPFQVPPEGEVKYQYFIVDPGFTEDKWIQAAECRPGNRAVVHHIIVAAMKPGSKKQEAHGDLDSKWLAATAPGARPMILPEGRAKFVPAGSRLVFQLHYTPNGTPQEDISSVGLIFADPATVKQEVVTQNAVNRRIRIPPGDPNYRLEATHTFSRDSLMLAMFPHMHLRGKSFRYTAIYPDGDREVLLDVPRYDFNWQNSYIFAEPKPMPAGTKLHCVAHFDNSEENLANPDPTVEVRWGDQTWEEMMIGYFDMTLADQDQEP